jgi:hypothetical protein
MFLTEFSPISIKMAKEQGISLTPSEITGMCGRLRCCLVYEYEQYVEARKTLPKRGKRVVTPQGEGKVVDVYPLKSAVIVELDTGVTHEYFNHDLQPWDELEALRRKAQEPCDRHENGGCDCGKAGSQPSAESSEETDISEPDSSNGEYLPNQHEGRPDDSKPVRNGPPQHGPRRHHLGPGSEQSGKEHGKGHRRKR